jgi:hypothetical protein
MLVVPIAHAGIVDQPLPLKTTIATKDGKKKLKLKKRLPVLLTCSKDCSYKATMTVIAPSVKAPKKIGGDLNATGVLTLTYVLTDEGRRYLKDNIRKSKLKVKFSAKDKETGARIVKTKTYRFYK